MTPSLTVNYGLRYEHEPGVRERDNHITVGFDRDAAFPVQVPGLDLKGGLLYAGVDGNPTTQGQTLNGVAPRGGLRLVARSSSTRRPRRLRLLLGAEPVRRPRRSRHRIEGLHRHDDLPVERGRRRDAGRHAVEPVSRTGCRCRRATRRVWRPAPAASSTSPIRTASPATCSSTRSICSTSSAAATSWSSATTAAGPSG